MKAEATHNGAYRLRPAQRFYKAIKAMLDFLMALIAVLLLSLLFIGVAIAIKVDSKGPVFFVQKRIGLNGKLFSCLKFRSMYIDANHKVAGYEYADAEAYITKVGKFIRKYSIDELPQLFNVLAPEKPSSCPLARLVVSISYTNEGGLLYNSPACRKQAHI